MDDSLLGGKLMEFKLDIFLGRRLEQKKSSTEYDDSTIFNPK